MSPPHILLLGAHGNIARIMVPLFLAKSWSVTALVRNPAQKTAVLDLKADNPGALNVIVHSLADVKTSKDALSVIDKAKGVNWIVWAAGAGGKPGPNNEHKSVMTRAIDGTAAIAFAHAATHNDSIKRYLTISALIARRKKAPWWSDEDDAVLQAANAKEELEVYVEEKTKADECLTIWGDDRSTRDEDFRYVVLRPGVLTNGKETGKVQLGRTTGQGTVPRKDVATTVVKMLESGAIGWFDLQSGEEDLDSAVERVAKGGDKYTSIEGEPEKTRKQTAEDYAKTF